MPTTPEERQIALTQIEQYSLNSGGILPGMPFFIPGSILPEHFLYPDRSLILFSIFPDLEISYRAGLLDTLPYDTVVDTLVQYPGKWIETADDNGLLLPDISGMFPRAWRPTQIVDSGREAGSIQEDAIRNMTGYFQHANLGYSDARADEVLFKRVAPANSSWTGFASNYRTYTRWNFNASNTVPTAEEYRPTNTANALAIFVGQRKN